MSENLKPCPFCGESAAELAEIAYSGGSHPFIGCTACGVTTGDYDDEAAAIAAWNRRAPVQFSSDNLRAITEKEASE